MLDYNPLVWLDAQDAGTVNLVDGKVSQWANKANANHAVQTNESMRPLYGVNGVSNGYPSIEITSSGGVGFNLNLSSLGISEIIMVCSYKTGIENVFVSVETFISGPGSVGALRIMGNSYASTLIGSNALTSVVYKNNSETSTNTILPLPFTVCDFRFTQTSQTLWGILKNLDRAERSLVGFTGEILMFQNQLAAQDRIDIVNHLMQKWEIS